MGLNRLDHLVLTVTASTPGSPRSACSARLQGRRPPALAGMAGIDPVVMPLPVGLDFKTGLRSVICFGLTA